jgi:hypothetical protein
VTGRLTVQPTVRLAATVFTISEPLIRAEVKEMAYQDWLSSLEAARATTGANGNGTEPLAEHPDNTTDAEIDRLVARLGPDRVLAAIDRHTSPQFAFAAE